MSEPGLLLIDAPAMAYRAYYAMQQQNLRHPETGQPTWAIYGFFRMLFKLLQDYHPAMVAVVWDPGRKTFRSDIYTEYKATRKPMPDDLRSQIEEIRALLDEAKFPQLMVQNFEADDVIGTLAKRFGKEKKVLLITGDKDCYQLLNKNVHMLRGQKGVTEFTEISPEWVKEELGVTVEQIPDYMGLVGDTSDNIPGVRGVGAKSAADLIRKYGTIDGIYEKIGDLKGAIKKKLEESRANALLSRELATIRTDIKEAIDIAESSLRLPDYMTHETANIFRKAGFNQLYDDLMKSSGDAEQNDRSDLPKSVLINDFKSLEKLAKKLSRTKILSVDTETDSKSPMLARLVGISLYAGGKEAWYIALPPEGAPYIKEGIPLKEALPVLKEFLENGKIKKIGQNIKYDLLVLRNHGIELQGIVFDTMIASYLIDPNIRRHNLDDMAMDRLNHKMISYDEIAGKGKNRLTFDLLPPSQICDYACEDAWAAYRLREILEPEIKKADLEKVNRDIEIALIPVLADMEQAGVAIDREYFGNLSHEYEKTLKSLEKKIHKYAGRSFNINSTKELQKILFEELGLPHGKKTKTGYSTDQSVLEDLRGKHPVVDHLLDHRKFSKLKSTYVDALPQLINPASGRIHTSFNQTIAATGRLSSNEPNLQNIPVREDTGRAIRKGFIPAPGNELLSLDYSQIELRIMAHYSDDPALIEAFTSEHVDIHARTAASLFGVEEDEVTPDMRSRAKVVNFSIIYGVTEFGLSQNLGISRNEARHYIERFFDRYPGVRRYMDETVMSAEKTGYVVTLSGRKRSISDIDSNNRFRKEGAQRTAVNSPIQGTSADIIKLAMIRIHEDMAAKKLRSKMTLQVHDELIFDVIPEEKDDVLRIAKSHMENSVKLKVPLLVDYRFGKNWEEAH